MKIFLVVAISLLVLMQAVQMREAHNAHAWQEYKECQGNAYMPKPCEFEKW